MTDLSQKRQWTILNITFSCFFKTRKITLILRIKPEKWHLKKKHSHSGNCQKSTHNLFPVEFFMKYHNRWD